MVISCLCLQIVLGFLQRVVSDDNKSTQRVENIITANLASAVTLAKLGS